MITKVKVRVVLHYKRIELYRPNFHRWLFIEANFGKIFIINIENINLTAVPNNGMTDKAQKYGIYVKWTCQIQISIRYPFGRNGFKTLFSSILYL